MSGEKAENEQRQSALKEVRSEVYPVFGSRTKEKKYWGCPDSSGRTVWNKLLV